MVNCVLRTLNRGKRTKQKVLKGIVHIQATYNNTLITISETQGGVLVWSSSGACGFEELVKVPHLLQKLQLRL